MFPFTKLINGCCKFIPEIFYAAQHTWIEEIHLGIDIKSIVLERRTTHTQPVSGIQQTGGSCHFTLRVLYCLRFIKYDIIKLCFQHEFNITSQGTVCGYYHIMLFKNRFIPNPVSTMVNLVG